MTAAILGHRGRIGDHERVVELLLAAEIEFLAAESGFLPAGGMRKGGRRAHAEHRGHGHHAGAGRDPPGGSAGASPTASPAATPARAARRYTIRRRSGPAAEGISIMAVGRRPRHRGSGGCGTVIWRTRSIPGSGCRPILLLPGCNAAKTASSWLVTPLGG